LTNLSIPGYEPILHADSKTNAGGVGVYVSSTYLISLLANNELNSKFNCDCEDIWLKISDSSSKISFILGIIYQHPKDGVNNFLEALNTKLMELNNMNNLNYYILGDINIDLTPSNKLETIQFNYTNLLASNAALQLINKPTRVTKTSKTIIDHIITNNISNIIHPCIFLSDLSNHYPVACIIAGKPSTHQKAYIPVTYRDMRRFIGENYLMDLNISLSDLF